MRILPIIISALLYLVVYLCSIICFRNGEIALKMGKKSKSIVLIFLGIIVLCFFAGIRSETVGTDTGFYAKRTFLMAKNNADLSSIFIYQTDLGYAFLAYVSYKLFQSFGAMLFLTELLIVGPLCLAAIRKKDEISFTMVMTVFLFLLYPLTFNAMRQCISISLILYALTIIKEKRILGLLLLIASYSFHSSAIITLVIFLCIYTVAKGNLSISKLIIITFVLMICAIFFLNWINSVDFLINKIGILPEGFNNYLAFYKGVTSGGVSAFLSQRTSSAYADFIFRLFNFFIPFSLCWKNNCHTKKIYILYSLANITIYSLIFLLLKTNYGYRIVMGLDFINCFYFASFLSKNKTWNKLKTNNIVIYGLIFVEWFMIYGYYGMHQAFPFSVEFFSDILF